MANPIQKAMVSKSVSINPFKSLRLAAVIMLMAQIIYLVVTGLNLAMPDKFDTPEDQTMPGFGTVGVFTGILTSLSLSLVTLFAFNFNNGFK